MIRRMKIERFIESVKGLPELITEFDESLWVRWWAAWRYTARTGSCFGLRAGWRLKRKQSSSAGIRCDLAGPFRRLFRMNFRPCLNNAAKGISQDRDYRLLYKVSVPAFPVTDPRYDHSYDCFTVEFRHEAAVFVREFLPVFFLHTSKNGICDPHKVLKEKSMQFVSSSWIQSAVDDVSVGFYVIHDKREKSRPKGRPLF